MIKPRLTVVWCLIALGLLFFLSGCIDMELDLSVNHDGSGKAKIIAAATEPMFNELIDEMLRELREEEPGARISERYRDNRKVAEVELTFNDVAELSEHGFSVTHTRDEQRHRVEITTAEGFPMKISLRMPGRITDSNGSFSGSTAHFETSYMGGTYWAESGAAAAGGTMFALLVILAVIFGLAIWYFLSRKTTAGAAVSAGTARGGFCTNCGSPFPPSDRFCSQCGVKRDS